jgi:hypothetical protein
VRPPPVVNDDELLPLIDSYLSYADYFKAMFPLLLCETWEDIYRTWKERKAIVAQQRQGEESTSIWIKSFSQLERNSGLITLTCQSTHLDIPIDLGFSKKKMKFHTLALLNKLYNSIRNLANTYLKCSSKR